MSLYKQWVDLMEGQTDETFDAFWKEYSETETRIYTHILESKEPRLAGKFSELTAKFEADPVIFMGFLDGIQTSLNDLGTLEVLDDLHDLFFGENSLPCFQRIQIIRICFEHIEEKLFEVDVKIDFRIFVDCFQFHWIVQARLNTV